MDTFVCMVWITIFFLTNNGLQRILPAEAQKLTINQCVEYLDLQNKTHFTEIEVTKTTMTYFPEVECNNTTPQEDQTPLHLPNLKILRLNGNKSLLKMPNITGMTDLETLTVNDASLSTIPGKPFVNHRLGRIELFFNKLVQAPNLEGTCMTLSFLGLGFNRLTYLPHDYFEGCTKLTVVDMPGNQVAAFPNFAPIGSSLKNVVMSINHLSGTLLKDAIAMNPNLEHLQLHDNRMTAVEVNFCNQSKLRLFSADRNRIVRVENPYRDCAESIGTSPKPRIRVEGNPMPCDERRCWMKKYGSTSMNVKPGNCPDGREWNHITMGELCQSEGELHKVEFVLAENQTLVTSQERGQRSINMLITACKWNS